MVHFGLVWPEYSWPAFKVDYFDRSGHFGWSDQNVPRAPSDKIVVPSTALLYPTHKNINMLWLGLGLCNRSAPFHWACGINEISNRNFCWRELSTPGLVPFPTLNINIHPGINATCNENMVNKNGQKAILTGRPIFLGEGVAAHLGHQAFHLPLHDVASVLLIRR